MADVTVRLQALDGAWETCGADRARGVWPENVKGIRADQWGSKSVGFDLRRDPKSIWPDISAFTPVQIDIDGVHRWTGRVAQTPVRDDLDSVISVQCEGMQSHLDDDLYERVYVHTRLGDWKDARSYLSSVLTSWVAGGQVGAGDGKITLSWPIGTQINVGDSVGVILDLGPGAVGCAKVTLSVKRLAGNPSNMALYCRSAGDPSLLRGANPYDQDWTATALTGVSGGSFDTLEAVLPSGHRYVAVFVGGITAAYAPTADDGVEIDAITVYTDSTYESGNASVLTADTIVKDALASATVLLSADTSQVAAGTFNIPEFAPAEPRTPRQVWEAVDAFEDRLKKIDLQDRAVYQTKPTQPVVEVGAWSAMAFEDASANDGSEVYSRVIVVGTQPDGSPLRVERTQAQQTGVPANINTPNAMPQNGDFEVDVAGWTTSKFITRTTAVFHGGAASGLWDANGLANTGLTGGDSLTCQLLGTFRRGRVYTARFWHRTGAGAFGSPDFDVTFGNAARTDYTYQRLSTANGTFQQFTVSWTPRRDAVDPILYFTCTSTGPHCYFDDVTISYSAPTIVERQNFQRTKTLDVSFTLTTAAATQLADLWLRAHQRTPFKGTVKLTGHGAVRSILTGMPLPVDALLDMTGQLVRFTDRIDPDTGAVGRDARIAEVAVDPDLDEATVTLDNTRAGFDALLSRLDLVLGQGR